MLRVLIDVPPDEAPGILGGLVLTNLLQIRKAGLAGHFPVLDGLRAGQVARQRGLRLPPGALSYYPVDLHEQWKPWAQVLADGGGDCDDLVPAVVAEYIAAGLWAEPFAYEVPPAPTSPGPDYHVVVRVHPRMGRSWLGDPSIIGGMLET